MNNKRPIIELCGSPCASCFLLGCTIIIFNKLTTFCQITDFIF